MTDGQGLRHNSGKLRYDLVHPHAHEGMVKVITFGAQKYAERNWERGMAWSKVIASMKRHIAAIEKGEDFDPESGMLHIDHVQCNAHFLSAYYKIFKQGDDRVHTYNSSARIGLDIDEVLADFVGGMMNKYPTTMKTRAVYWNDYELIRNFPEVSGDLEFWSGLKPKLDPESLPFEPQCYITSRPVPTVVTEKWLADNKFPKAPVLTVGQEIKTKVEGAVSQKLDLFVDDCYQNFVELNKNKICCLLYDAPHNQRYNVGHKRITSLQEI